MSRAARTGRGAKERPIPPPDAEYWSLDFIARRWGCHRVTVRRNLSLADVPEYHFGHGHRGIVRFLASDVMRFEAERRVTDADTQPPPGATELLRLVR